MLSTFAMAVIVYTIIEAPAYGWSSPRSIAGFALGAALLASFIAWEMRVRDPMLDVGLFRNPRFTAACAAVTVSFFTLLGFIFVMTQYFQFIKRYDALSAGVHLLPVALSVGVSSVLGTKLAVRFGTKIVVAAGSADGHRLLRSGCRWSSRPRTAYSTIAIQMVLYGTGMGLTSAPATEAIMGVVPIGKAGVGSAVNDATRLLGGTLGVAVIGSVYASIYSSHLTCGASRRAPACARRGRPLLRRCRARSRRTPRCRGPRRARRGRSSTPPRGRSSRASARAAWWRRPSPPRARSPPPRCCPPSHSALARPRLTREIDGAAPRSVASTSA